MTAGQVTHPESAPPSTQPGVPAHRRMRRWLRRLGIAAIVLVGLVVVSTSVNFLMEKQEKSQTTPYGDRVRVDGGAMNVWTNGCTGRPTIVLLTGLGTAAPALDFAPLIRQLDKYQVIVVEGFGYGYSDMTARPRTVENITAELHEVLLKIDVAKPYVLAGHSIAGFYTLAYADRYPDELAAVIGIDPTVPASKATTAAPPSGEGWLGLVRLLRTTGLVRWGIAIAPGLAEPGGDGYTANELRQIRRMAEWNFLNPALVDETNRIGSNAAALRGVTYPDTLPVLDMLSSETLAGRSDWVQLHEDQLRNVERHEVVVLDGPHYLHWTQSRAMAEMITEFLSVK